MLGSIHWKPFWAIRATVNSLHDITDALQVTHSRINNIGESRIPNTGYTKYAL